MIENLVDIPQKQAPQAGSHWGRKFVLRQLEMLKQGAVIVQDGHASWEFGDQHDLQARLQIHHQRFYQQAIWGGRLGIAESYLDGEWDCDDLTALFRIFIRNESSSRGLDRGLTWLTDIQHKFYHWWRQNTRRGSQKNIADHYDLGNEFYQLWLDDTMAYSSGLFTSHRSPLHEASHEKFDRVCRKLQLCDEDSVIEIGTGWGGFALHAAQNYGTKVTTTTISQQQHAIAAERIQQAGLNTHVQLLKQDYRDLKGQFDKLVSIEMIEAVGHKYLNTFFRQCSQLLKPQGSMVLQAIVMPEYRYDEYLRSVDFIQRYIFPGGCLPSVGAMLEAAGQGTDLRLVHVEDFAPHYAETLRCWRRNFHAKLDQVRELGYPERFIRLWNYYLCYCEAAFEERCVGVVQIQFDKPQNRRDPLLLSDWASASL